MHGTIATYTNGCPWPGGELVTFERSAVAAIAHVSAYNDFVDRYIARLADGREVFVKVGDQPAAEDRKWLQRLCGLIHRARRKSAIAGTLVVPSRDVPFVLTWRDAGT